MLNIEQGERTAESEEFFHKITTNFVRASPDVMVKEVSGEISKKLVSKLMATLVEKKSAHKIKSRTDGKFFIAKAIEKDFAETSDLSVYWVDGKRIIIAASFLMNEKTTYKVPVAKVIAFVPLNTTKESGYSVLPTEGNRLPGNRVVFIRTHAVERYIQRCGKAVDHKTAVFEIYQIYATEVVSESQNKNHDLRITRYTNTLGLVDVIHTYIHHEVGATTS
jgi:hypothetical protein